MNKVNKQSLRELIKKILIVLAILIGGAVIGISLMMAVFKVRIPEERYNNVMHILSAEGYHPRESIRDGGSTYYHELYPDILDFGTDELIVEYSMENPTDSLIKHTMIPEYARYWHGYVIFLRPLLRVFDLAEFRMLNFWLQLLLSAALGFLLYRKTNKIRYPLAWLSIYLMLGPNSMGCNMQYSSIYYTAVMSSILILLLEKKLSQNHNYIYLFLLSGMLTVYFDFLTYPLLSWIMPAAFMILTYKENSKVRNIIKLAVSGAAWVVGYVVFWAEKWLIAQIVLGGSFIRDDALAEVALRTGSSDSMSLLKRFRSLFVNWDHLTYAPLLIILILWTGFFIYGIIRYGIKNDSRVPALLISILSVPAWFIVCADHTGGHHLFTWRIDLGAVLVAMLIICIVTEGKAETTPFHIRIAIPIAGLLAGLGLYALLPIETEESWNYDIASEEKALEDGDNTYSLTFIPKYSHICNLAPLIKCEDHIGKASISLIDDGKIIRRSEFRVEPTSPESVIVDIPVNWLVKKGKPYTLDFSFDGLSAPVQIWYTTDTSRPEYDGDEAIGISYTYYTHFTDIKTAVLYVLTNTVLIICTYVAVAGGISKYKRNQK